MVDAACDCGVVGWVRNRRDGSVEALVQGTPEAVAGIVAWAQHGPLAAVVSDVAETEVPVDAALRDFLSLPTA